MPKSSASIECVCRVRGSAGVLGQPIRAHLARARFLAESAIVFIYIVIQS